MNTSGTVNAWRPDYWSPLTLGWGGGTGIWNQNGGITTAASDFVVGDAIGGSGTLNLNGGVFATNAILGAITQYGSQGTIIFNGGTMRVLEDNGNFFNDNTGALTLQVTSAGGTMDTNGFDIGVVQPLADGVTGGGTFTKAGNGNLTLAATNTFTGTMAVAAGQLTFTAANVFGGSNATREISVSNGAGLGVALSPAPGVVNAIANLTVGGAPPCRLAAVTSPAMRSSRPRPMAAP